MKKSLCAVLLVFALMLICCLSACNTNSTNLPGEEVSSISSFDEIYADESYSIALDNIEDTSLESDSPRYTSDEQKTDNVTEYGYFRELYVSGDVNVSIYDYTGALIAGIDNDGTCSSTVTDYSYIYAKLANEQKYAVLPDTSGYRAIITATANTAASVRLKEFHSAAAAHVRIVDFAETKLAEGEKLLMHIPAFTTKDLRDLSKEGSSTNYTLVSAQTSVPIAVSSDFRGEKAFGASAFCKIDVNANDTELGSVEGAGYKERGDVVVVSAKPTSEAGFDGWFNGGKQVSDSENYIFKAEEDVSLIANFSAR